MCTPRERVDTTVPLVTTELMESSGVNLVEDGWFESRSFASCYKQRPSVCNDSHVKTDDITNPSDHVANSFGYLRSPWNMHSSTSCSLKPEMQPMPSPSEAEERPSRSAKECTK